MFTLEYVTYLTLRISNFPEKKCITKELKKTKKQESKNKLHTKHEQFKFPSSLIFSLDCSTEWLSLTLRGRLFHSKLLQNITEFIP